MEVFTRAAQKAQEQSGEDFLEALLRERPDLKGQDYRIAQNGIHSHTLIFENEVFKAPKWKTHIANFDDECVILRGLQGKGLPIPEVTYIGKENVFFGMTRVKGEDLPDIVGKLTMQEKQAIADDITGFIIQLAKATAGGGNFGKHADIMKNVLVNPETKRLASVIDLESLRYVPKDMLPPKHVDELTGMVVKAFNQRKDEISSSRLGRVLSRFKRKP